MSKPNTGLKRRPALTKRKVELLRTLANYCSAGADELVSNECPDDIKFAADLYEAAEWIDRLCAWYDQRSKEKQ